MFRRGLWKGTSAINGGGESMESVILGVGARRDGRVVPVEGGVSKVVVGADGTCGSCRSRSAKAPSRIGSVDCPS
jgi:hypothetical protein